MIERERSEAQPTEERRRADRRQIRPRKRPEGFGGARRKRVVGAVCAGMDYPSRVQNQSTYHPKPYPMRFPVTTLVTALVAALSLGALAADKKVKLKTKPYPMDTCVVSGEKLGSMGDAVVFVEGDQEVQLCCKSCRKDFDADKAANLKKIADAWKTVKAYPLTTCIVSDEALEDGKAVGVVVEGREFLLCCKSCLKDLKKDTAKFVKKFDEAAKKKS